MYRYIYLAKRTRLGLWLYERVPVVRIMTNWAIGICSPSGPPPDVSWLDHRIEIDPAWLVPGPVRVELGAHKRNLEEG